MGLAGFCRNCLADWVEEASEGTLEARTRPARRSTACRRPEWKAKHQAAATPEQLARM
ncbi:DUF1244 domain-containing protein [Caulobacter segnis]